MSAATDYRPRRSVLYMPSSNERALEKAKTLPVDGLILDLEDAVAPDHKATARDNACAAARSGDYGQREVTIRVNASGTQWHDDDLAGRLKLAMAADDEERRQHQRGAAVIGVELDDLAHGGVVLRSDGPPNHVLDDDGGDEDQAADTTDDSRWRQANRRRHR